MILAFLLAIGAASPPTTFEACMAEARAVRPRQHCRAVEIERRDALIAKAYAAALAENGSALFAQRYWSAETATRCDAIGRAARGSLASEKAQACRLDAQAQRLKSFPAPPMS